MILSVTPLRNTNHRRLASVIAALLFFPRISFAGNPILAGDPDVNGGRLEKLNDGNVPAEAALPTPATTLAIQTADGYCVVSLDTTKAPELRGWAQQKLGPVLIEWYPKIAAMLPSEGFTAPKEFSIAIQPMDGVAYTVGREIHVSSAWLSSQLNGEAVGSVIHEVVHVVQQYRAGSHLEMRPPGWLVEGIPDYIRFFKFEPQCHGADLVWLQGHRKLAINYDGGYRISANFLDYVVEHYDADKTLLRKVNAACRQGTYTDGLWLELTGKPLKELNVEWKATVQTQLAD